MSYAIVHSSHGDLSIDKDGLVLTDQSDYWDGSLKDITKFDIDEYLTQHPDASSPDVDPLEIDILDIGYWMRSGQHELPLWRDDDVH